MLWRINFLLRYLPPHLIPPYYTLYRNTFPYGTPPCYISCRGTLPRALRPLRPYRGIYPLSMPSASSFYKKSLSSSFGKVTLSLYRAFSILISLHPRRGTIKKSIPLSRAPLKESIFLYTGDLFSCLASRNSPTFFLYRSLCRNG